MIVNTTEKVDKAVLTHFHSEFYKQFPPCALSFIRTDGSVLEHTKDMGCHHRLSMLDTASVAKGIYFSLWYPSNHMEGYRIQHPEHVVTDYYDFILDPKISPWRNVLKNSRVLKDKNGRYEAVYVTNIEDLPHQYLSNFAVASRQPLEFSVRMKTWNHLRFKLKLPPLHSLYILSHFNFESFWKVASSGHFPFDPTSPVSFKRLKDADPNVDPRKIYKADLGYSPMNAIWTGEDAPIFNSISSCVKYTGSFSSWHTTGQTIYGGWIVTKPFTIPSQEFINNMIEKGDIFK